MDRIEAGTVVRYPQEGVPVQAPKIHPDQCEIAWDRTAEEVHRFIRGYSPRPGAYTFLDGQRVKIYRSRLPEAPEDTGRPPGTVVRCGRNGIAVQTGGGTVDLLDLQAEGKCRMTAAEFVCGKRLRPGTRLGGV
jgi:methionyl-tRNA formyltransferase